MPVFTITKNSIYDNTALGIDLGDNWGNPNGPTHNDHQDLDAGPNSLQNHPTVTSSMTACDSTTNTRNVPMFNSTPNTTFVIDYYANPSWDSNSGLTRQGEQWVTSETVTTDAEGNADLSMSIISGITNPSVTATDPNGNTSEFGSINTVILTNCGINARQSLATSQSLAGVNIGLPVTISGATPPQTLQYRAVVNGQTIDSSNSNIFYNQWFNGTGGVSVDSI